VGRIVESRIPESVGQASREPATDSAGPKTVMPHFGSVEIHSPGKQRCHDGSWNVESRGGTTSRCVSAPICGKTRDELVAQVELVQKNSYTGPS